MKRANTVATVIILILLIATKFTFAVNNPVSYNSGITDCDVVKHNGEYYISGNWLKGDMLRSRDLMSWGERKHVFSWTNPNGWHTQVNSEDANYDIHGTHLRYYNGTFHLYAHLDVSSGITHATSDNIWGPYTEPNPYSSFTGNGWLIDADTFLDEDGSFYYYETNRQGSSGHDIRARTMSDFSTLSGSWNLQIQDNQSWEGNVINEGSKVLKHHDRYYMLYNGEGTGNPNYAIGCVEASNPLGFSNSGKYSNNPIVSRATPSAGAEEITHIGQSWVVEGLNGFEKWFGYFAQTTSDNRTQRIDRMHFFDRKLFIDGPTDRFSTGYHPKPAKPQLLNIFSIPDGPMPASDWTLSWEDGIWGVENEEAIQTSQDCFSLNIINREAATNYLIEANVRMTGTQDNQEKAGVVAYYEDPDNWIIVGLDRSLDYNGDNWYCHIKENGIDQPILAGGYNGSMDYSAFHKIRVTKNGSNFDIRIDDMIPPGHSTISTNFTGAATPGIFSNHAPASYDGIIYTIGWEEYDNDINAWGDCAGGLNQFGSWSYSADGITGNSTARTYKGDLMEQYEFATQIYKVGSGDGLMGVVAVAIDTNNYLTALIDTSSNELIVNGLKNASPLGEQRANIADKDDYNLRIVKLPTKVICFVDGVETVTYNIEFPACAIGLATNAMTARFNGIMTYKTQPDSLPVPWDKTDIGAVGFPGTANYYDNALYMSASGSDIWHLNDEFTFANADFDGDWEFSARIVNLDESDYWSKAALMFRNDLSDNSAMVMLNATGGAHGLAHAQLIWRDAAGSGTGVHDIADLSYPFWLKLKRQGTKFTGSYSVDGENWSEIATVAPPLNANGKIGFGVTSHNNDRIATAVFDNIALAQCSNEVPSPWSSVDVGPVGHAGCADYDVDTWNVTGSGLDIWGVEDSFHFLYHPWKGDGEMVAKITSLDETDFWAKTGVMFRENLDAGSKHSMVMINASTERVSHVARAATNGASGARDSIFDITLPYWIKIQRVGNNFRGYHSSNGTSWQYIYSWNVVMPQDIFVGLAVTSHNNDKLCHASFENVRMPVCSVGISDGDFNDDCVVNKEDLHIFATDWLTSNSERDIFVDGSNIVNLKDMAIIAQNWLNCGWDVSQVCP